MRSFLLLLLLLPSVLLAQPSGSPIDDSVPILPAKRWAVVMGATDYKELGKLQFGRRDAESFRNLLVKDFRFDPQNVTLLTDGGTPETAPTVKNVDQTLDKILKNPALTNGDLFVFFFSGHGVGLPSGDYLLPTDATKETMEKVGIPISGLVEKLSKRGIKNILFIADACRGGEANDFGNELLQLSRTSNLAVLLGCKPGKRSYEYPQLRNGIFTNQLVKVMRDDSARDEISGVLWASDVAEEVQKRVVSYTERDYPGDPQQPSAWTNESVDVLLNAKLPKNLSPDTLAGIVDKAQKLEPTLYAASVRKLAEALFEDERYDESIRILRGLEQVSAANESDLLYLAMAEQKAERPREAEKTFQRLLQRPPSFILDCAIIAAPEGSVSRDRRNRAAESVLKQDPTPSGTLFAFGGLLLASNVPRAIAATKLARAYEDCFEKSFLLGTGLALEDKHKLALPFLEKALDQAPANHRIGIMKQILISVQYVGGDAEVIQRLDKLTKQYPKDPKPLLMRGQFALDSSDFKRANECGRKVLTLDISADDLMQAVRLLGSTADQHREKIKELSGRFPYSWKAALARILASAAAFDVQAAIEDSQLADAYKANEIEVIAKMFEARCTAIDQALAEGRMDMDQYASLVFGMTSYFSANRANYGLDADYWWLMLRLMLTDVRTVQAWTTVRGMLPPTRTANAPELRSLTFVAAMNACDFAAAEQIFAAGGFYPSERNDLLWLRGISQLIQDRPAEAVKIFRTARPASAGHLQVSQAATLWADVWLKGATPPLVAKLKAARFTDPAARAMLGLAWLQAKKPDLALPLLEESRDSRSIFFQYVHGRALKSLIEYYVAAKKPEKAQGVWLQWVRAEPDAYFHRGIAIPVAKSRSVVGSIKWPGFFLDDHLQSGLANTVWTVDNKGNFTLTVSESLTFVAKGTVDKNGNVVAKATIQGKPFVMRTRLLPLEFYTGGQVSEQAFPFYDEQGYRLMIMGVPKLPEKPGS